MLRWRVFDAHLARDAVRAARGSARSRCSRLRKKGVEFSYLEGLLFSSLVIAALFDLWCIYYLLQVDPIAQVGKRERSLIGVLLRQLGLWPIFLAPVAFYFRTKKASPTAEV